MSDDARPSLDDLHRAIERQQRRVVSVSEMIELRSQAKAVAFEIMAKAAAAAATGGIPIPEDIVAELADAVIDHVIGFIADVGDAG